MDIARQSAPPCNVGPVDEKERADALRRIQEREHPWHDPILDLPLAHRVFPPRHLDLPREGDVACGSKARTELDFPLGNMRTTIFCGLRRGHEGEHFGSEDLAWRTRILDGYVWG